MLHLNIIKYINDICFVLFCSPWGLLLWLSLLFHDRLRGWTELLPRTEPNSDRNVCVHCSHHVYLMFVEKKLLTDLNIQYIWTLTDQKKSFIFHIHTYK